MINLNQLSESASPKNDPDVRVLIFSSVIAFATALIIISIVFKLLNLFETQVLYHGAFSRLVLK